MVLGDSLKHAFFGYYDITPFNGHGEVIFLELDKDSSKADIVLYNRKTNTYEKIASTLAWNWQQGSRLRWFPKSNDRIIFNDFKDGVYFARDLNIRCGEEKIYNYPLYDIDSTGNYGLSLNFERLGVMRPGYGYTCSAYQESNDLKNEGIDLIDLKTNQSKRIITYDEIVQKKGLKQTDFSKNYINHLSFSPSGKNIMFFWLTILGDFHKADLMVYNLDTKNITPLETEGKVSHYLWLDDNRLLCTVYDLDGNCCYFIYGLDGTKEHVFKNIDYDGHPIWYKDGQILTDSYPNQQGYQKLIVCDIHNNQTSQLMEVFQKPAISIEKRTDLHPRYDATTDTICVDISPKGIRKLLLLSSR